MKFPLNDFYKNRASANSVRKTNSVMKDLFNDMKKNSWAGPKMNVTFKTTLGHTHNLIVRYETTIDELLKYYLRSMNRTEFIGSDKICFLFNASRQKFGIQTSVATYFKPNFNPNIIVNFYNVSLYGNWYNWTKEEVEQIKKEREKIELENQVLEHKFGEEFKPLSNFSTFPYFPQFPSHY